MVFKRGFAIPEAALGIPENANLLAVKEPNRIYALVNRPAVGAGIAIDRASHPSGTAGHGVDAEETVIDREVHKVLENIEKQGFHLQMPASQAIDPMTEDWGTDG